MTGLSISNADWFKRPETQAIFACLNRDGFEARAVGGALRRTLFGRQVTEIDFATTARPEDVIRLAARAGLKSVPTGLDHGTVTIIANGVPFEVTSLRRDVETDGRRAVVEFGENWAEDARRRDFTINALFADASGEVHDPLGGLPDLLARRVRFIGDPHARIKEDYLRILRFFRFSAEYAGGDFDEAGVLACVQERDGLARLSRERVRAEILRILVARRAEAAIRIMDESGILLLLFGGVEQRARFEEVCAIEAALAQAPNPILRLGALATFVEEDAERVAERLRLSSAEAAELTALAAAAPHVSAHMDRPSLEAALYRTGPAIFRGRLLLAWAESGAAPDDAAWRETLGLADVWRRPKFPLSGADLIALGWQPGPKLGEALKALEIHWIENGFKPARDELLALAGPAPASE